LSYLTIKAVSLNLKVIRNCQIRQGWYEFRRQLAYKLDWLEGTVITVPANSNRTGLSRNYISKNNRQI